MNAPIVLGGLALILATAEPARAATSAPTQPEHRCVADPNGKIDFRGTLGSAGGPSFVRIFSQSDVSDFYLSTLQDKMGTGGPPTPTIATLQDEEHLGDLIQRIPQLIASESIAQIVNGAFSCLGFAPGRYSFLAEVHGNGARASDPPLGTTYYRADVDVSSVNHRAVVVVQGFRRIGTNPPQL